MASHDDGERRNAWLVAALLLAVADWVVTWALIGETAQGTREVAGLSEGNLRALQNPGTLLMLLSLRAAWRRYRLSLGELGGGGFTVTAFALVVVLVGNLVEFGLWGEGPLDSQDPGAAIFFTGLLLLVFGVVMLAISAVGALLRRARRG